MNVTFVDEQDDPIPAEPLMALAERVLADEGLPAGTEVSLSLVDVEQMTAYHERFLGKPGPTDVLAFPLEELEAGSPPRRADPGDPPLHLGDVMICPDVVRRNAAAAQVPFDDEMALMVVHGLLHLLGYDHEEDEEAEVMEARERALLAAVGRRRP